MACCLVVFKANQRGVQPAKTAKACEGQGFTEPINCTMQARQLQVQESCPSSQGGHEETRG